MVSYCHSVIVHIKITIFTHNVIFQDAKTLVATIAQIKNVNSTMIVNGSDPELFARNHCAADAGVSTKGKRKVGVSTKGKRKVGVSTKGKRKVGVSTKGKRKVGVSTRRYRTVGTYQRASCAISKFFDRLLSFQFYHSVCKSCYIRLYFNMLWLSDAL